MCKNQFMKLNEGLLEQLAGSKTKLKVLRFLITDARASSEREIAARLGVSHMAVNRIMQEFHSANLVEPTLIGKSRVWAPNQKSYAYKGALLLRDFFLKQTPVQALREMLSEELARLPAVKSAWIIGSVAEKKELPSSDIDVLLIVGKGASKEKASRFLAQVSGGILEKFGNRLSPLIIPEDEPQAEKWMKSADEKGIKLLPR